jgi:peptidoglycan/LPS O-acetylase OafA/YrhL
LDGLRFIAVFGVLFYHYSDWLRTLQLPFTIEMGTFISFFFVLSSYLISSILLTKKQEESQRIYTAYNFLVRRTLRIFPAYYFYLCILLLLPFAGHDVREHPLLYFTYLSNFRTYFSQVWDPLTSHLWTLSVEEQFYIVWLVVILAVPNRYLVKVFYLIIIAGVAFRLLYFSLHKGSATEIIPMVILTPSCIDAFACGGLLAWLHQQDKTCAPLLKKVFLVVLPLWIILILLHARLVLLGFDRIFAEIGSMILIERASQGYTNMFGKFLQNKVVTYLGKISYGIYLYHLLLPFVFWKLYNPFSVWLLHSRHIDLTGLTIFLVNPVTSFCLYFLLTIAFATLSWYGLEKPISSFKRYFSYSPSSKKKVPASAG